MIGMTPKAKIAVTLPQEVVDGVRRIVAEGRADSVSAYIAQAVEKRLGEDDFAGLLDDMLQASGGPLTDDERERIDREMGWD